jgi:tetratricopeptide (TPR) repeat protein
MSLARANVWDPPRNAKIAFIILLFLIPLCLPVTALTATIGTGPGSPDTTIQNASYYEDQGKALMAERSWSVVIDNSNRGRVLYPYNPELLCLQAYALRKTGYYQESVDLISLAIPNDTRPVRYANRGYGYLAMGKTADAIHDADSAIALDPSYATAYALRASALRMAGNISGAEYAIDEALIIDPENAYYLQVQGEILADRGSCSDAIDAFRHSIAINNNIDQPWPGLPNATTELNRTEARCAAAQQILTTTPKASFPAVLLAVTGLGVVVVFNARQKR